MTNEQLRMQMLAGVITEGEYAAIINKQIEKADKASLNESMIGGIVGVGAINQIPATPKTDYEMAFEHFLGERYTTNFDNPNQDLEEDDSYNDMDQQISDEVNEVGDDSYKKNLLDLIITGEKQLIDLEKLKGKVPNIDSSIAKAKEVVDGLKASLEGTNEGKEVEEGIHDKDITSAPHTNVKGEMGAYNPKQRAANLAKLQNFGPKDKK
jgi:hypothetical protein